MSVDSYGQWIGTPMDEDAIEALLRQHGYGILALAAGDRPYSIPVSFGYDHETPAVSFVFLRSGGGDTKFDFIDHAGPARLLVTDVAGRFDWRSVAVEGPVTRVDPDDPGWNEVIEPLAANGWFTRGFERDPGLEAIVGYRLDVETVEGLQVTDR